MERAYAATGAIFALSARIGNAHRPAEPETLTLYLADLHAPVPRSRHLGPPAFAIALPSRRRLFELAETEHEVIRSVHRGLRRRVGVAQHPKTALIDDYVGPRTIRCRINRLSVNQRQF